MIESQNLTPAFLVKRIKEIKETNPDLDWREIMDKAFDTDSDFNNISSFGKALEQIAGYYSTIKKDFVDGNLTLDAFGRPEPKTRVQRLFQQAIGITAARQSPVGQSLTEVLGEQAFVVQGPEAVTVPFSMVNTETGAMVQGEVVEEIEGFRKQLTPVSSSNVRGVGQFGNELLVQFHTSGLTPRRTYRYRFDRPEAAEEAYRALLTTGSPGRWIWQNIRGHVKGETITSSKIGPAILTGTPTIGGTSASLVPYEVSNRVPVTRMEGFEKASKQLQRGTPNPATNPQTSRRVEAVLETRKELREIGKQRTSRVSELPRIDFVYVGNVLDLTEDYPVKEHTRQGGKVHVVAHTRGEESKKSEKQKIELKEGQNEKLERWRQNIKTMKFKEKLAYIDEESEYHLRSMVEALGFELNQITGFKLTYIDPEYLFAIEHEHLHNVDSDNINEYIANIPPIIRVWDEIGGIPLGNDGNHRVNTCAYYNKKVPTVLLYTNPINNDFTEDDALSECTSRGYEKEECFKFFNAAQTKATEKAKKPYTHEGTKASMKNYDISMLKRKLTESERDTLSYVDKAVNLFPKKLFEDAHPRILIVGKIPDHPRWKETKGKVPQYYQQVGLNATYEDVEGSYDIKNNECIIALANTKKHTSTYSTVFHELAHSIWYNGYIPSHLKEMFTSDFEVIKSHKQLKAYYKDIGELFALLFETDGHFQLPELMRKSHMTENDAMMILKTYKRIREWAED